MEDPVRPVLRTTWLQKIFRWKRVVTPVDTGRDGDVDAARLRVQVDVIREAFRKADLPVSGGPSKGSRPPRDDADVHYLYRPGQALVRAEAFSRLEEFFRADENRDRFEGVPEAEETSLPGLLLASLPERKDEGDPVLLTIEELERAGALAPGDVTPDHVVYVTAKSRLCPATEPEMTRSRMPWPRAETFDKSIPDGDKVRVAVVDTGLWKDAVGSAVTPWLETDDVFAGTEDLEHVNPAAIHPYAGHGTFVAGIIECLAAETHIDVEGALPHGGAVYESDLCRQLHDALTENRPQIISMSAGTHTRGGHPMLGFVLLAENHRLDENDDVMIVAAAGNDASSEPFWPAAFSTKYPWVVSVGSVDPDRKVSDFSNHGKDWVSVYARGRDIINAFPTGAYTCYEPPNVGQVRTFKGLAQWSGTSFSTPIVTGLIAAHMRDHGTSARAAWTAVLATATTVHDSRIGEDVKIVGPLT